MNFFSVIKNKTHEEIRVIFLKYGWSIRKCSWTNLEFRNDWSDLVLEGTNLDLLLRGEIVFNDTNLKIIKQVFQKMKCPYKFELYQNDELLEEEVSNDFITELL